MADKAIDKLESEIIFQPSALDGDAINSRMMRNIADAESVDDVLDGNVTAVLKLDDIANETVTVESVSFHEAADEYADGGWGFFAVMQLADGRVVSTGAKTVVLKLYRISQLQGFPLESAVVFSSNRTRNGFNAWDMRRATA